MKRTAEAAKSGDAEQVRVLVVYEDNATREHAVQFCEQLANQHCPERGPAVEWQSFAELTDPKASPTAAEAASAANFVVFAVSAGNDFPQEIKLWIEGWLGRRGDREGALVGLVPRPQSPCDAASLKEIYLRFAAHRAGMDYLSHVPPTLPKPLPDSLDSFTEQAGEVTSLLDEILRTWSLPTPPR